MKKFRCQLSPDPGRTARAVLWPLPALILGLSGCGEEVDPPVDPELDASLPVTPHPVLERDLEDIEQGGVLRLITQYNSSSYFIHKGGQAGFDYELVGASPASWTDPGRGGSRARGRHHLPAEPGGATWSAPG